MQNKHSSIIFQWALVCYVQQLPCSWMMKLSNRGSFNLLSLLKLQYSYIEYFTEIINNDARYYCVVKVIPLRHIRSVTCKMINFSAILSWILENLIHFSESSNQAWSEKKVSLGKMSSNLQPSKSEIIIFGASSIHRTLGSELHQYVLLSIPGEMDLDFLKAPSDSPPDNFEY